SAHARSAREPPRIFRPRPAAPRAVRELAWLALAGRRRLLHTHGTAGPGRDRRTATRDARARGSRGADRDRARHTPGPAFGRAAAVAHGCGGAHRWSRRPLASEFLARDAAHNPVLSLSLLVFVFGWFCRL